MVYTLMIVMVILLAVLAAAIIIILAIYFNRAKKQNLKKELDAQQVDEITSTWTLNH